MADIFVSYARADRTRVAPLVAALEAQGFSVWWDPAISPGQEFDRLISSELEAARAIIVVWTPASVDSRWVRGEAREAADRAMLVPVRFENAKLPLDVRSLHTTDLDDWREDTLSPAFQELLRAVRALLNAPRAPASTSAPPKPTAPQVRMTSIVSVDVAGYSKRTEADATDSAREVLALRGRLNAIAARHGGRIFNTAGDSIMMEFAAAKEALAAICELLDDRPLSEPETRVGAHLGDVTVAANGDLLGHGVNVAARLMAQAKPGRALISGALRDALGYTERPLHPLGELALAKMDTRVAAFEISAQTAESRARPLASRTRPFFRRRRGLIAAIGIALAAATIGILELGPFGLSGKLENQSTPSTTPLRVAVLPFDALSDSSDLRHFASGVTDEIISTLSDNQVQTISRSESVALRGATQDEVIAKLGANLLLDGTVEQDENNILVRVHLDAPSDHTTLWSGDFKRAAKESRTLRTEVAARVGGLMQLALFAKSLGTTPIDNQTLALTLKVTDNLRFSTDPPQEATAQAIQLARQVVARAPNFAWGHSSLSAAIGLYSQLVPGSPAEVAKQRQEAIAEAKKALAIDPKDAMAYFTLAGLSDPRHFMTSFESVVLKAIAAEPHPPMFVGGLYGREGIILLGVGRLREAEPFLRRAVALDPLSSWERTDLVSLLVSMGHMAEATSVMEQCLELWPDDSSNVRATNLLMLAFNGAPADALAVLDDPDRRPYGLDQSVIEAWRAFINARKTPSAEARARAIKALQSALTPGLMPAGIAAQMFARLGDLDSAFAAAEHADPSLTSTFYDPAMAKMRADPRFMPLAAKLGLVDYWQSTDKWPDFCSASDAPYDCKAEARKAVSAAR